MNAPNTLIVATPYEDPALMSAPLTVNALIAAIMAGSDICTADNSIPKSPVYSAIEQITDDGLRPSDPEETPRTLTELKQRLEVEKRTALDEIDPTDTDYGKGRMNEEDFSRAMDTATGIMFNAAYETMADKSPAVVEGAVETSQALKPAHPR